MAAREASAIRLQGVPPAPALAPFVLGYWFIEDLIGSYAGQPIRTTPNTAAILTVNFGRPCGGEFAVGAPRASLLGVQSAPRGWRSSEGCYFVMVVLSPHGLARLFPEHGPDLADNMHDLGAVLGDRTTHRLTDDLAAAWEPRRVAERLDRWLDNRLALTRPPPELGRWSRAWDVLRRTGRVDAAASDVSVSPRQLERWFVAHVGHAPKRLVLLDRIEASLRAAQTGTGDPRSGFSDQAHQIRSWRRYLGVTPGQYARAAPSMLARHFVRDPGAAPGGFARFL